MSSAVLYLAIVAVWGVVLVPMWLRRDGEGIGRLLHRRGPESPDVEFESSEPVEEPVEVFEEPIAPRRRATRGAVIARRRRRTLGLSLLTVTAIVTVAAGVTPAWFVIPPIVLLAGHLSLLRVAVRMDAVRREERRRRAALHRAELARREQQRREAEEATRTAEIIELHHRREEVYDQYTDLRAVGD
jgi:DNA-binding helix-hairpin-helix protein with protein kinase domain